MFVEWTKSANMPTGKVLAIVEEFHKMHPTDKSFKKHHDDLVMLIDKHQYQVNWTKPARIESVITKKNGELYLEYLAEKGERTIVPRAVRTKVDGYADYVRYNYHNLLNASETQVPIYFDVDGVACKGLVDILTDFGNYIKITDLKFTQLPFSNINALIRNFRYDIQLSFYAYGVAKLYGKDVKASLLIYSEPEGECMEVELSLLDLVIAEEGAVRETGVVKIGDKAIQMKQYIKGWREYFNNDTTVEPVSIESIWN